MKKELVIRERLHFPAPDDYNTLEEYVRDLTEIYKDVQKYDLNKIEIDYVGEYYAAYIIYLYSYETDEEYNERMIELEEEAKIQEELQRAINESLQKEQKLRDEQLLEQERKEFERIKLKYGW